MGNSDHLIGKYSDFESIKADRESRIKGRDVGYGMLDSDWDTDGDDMSGWESDDWETSNDSSGWGVSENSNENSSNGWGNTNGGSFNSNWGQPNALQPQQQQQQQQRQGMDVETAIITTLSVSGKAGLSFIKAFGASLKQNTPEVWVNVGRGAWVGSCVIAGVVIILTIAKLAMTGGVPRNIMGVIWGSGISFCIGLYMWESGRGKIRRSTSNVVPSPVEIPPIPDTESYTEEDSDWGSDDSDSDWEDTIDDEDDWGSDDSDSDWESPTEVEEQEPPAEINSLEALEGVREITPGTQTRQYLFEEHFRILPKVNPGFSDMREYDEDSREFLVWVQIIRDSALQVGMREDAIPEVEIVRYNLSMVQVVTTRPRGFKAEALCNEITNIYSADEYGNTVREGVYTTAREVGSKCYFNVVTGNSYMVSLRDALQVEKDWVKDTDIKMPIILGTDHTGKVLKFDLHDTFAMIVSGEPRSGKSWGVQALIEQACMFMSPRLLHFEIFDIKAGGSDYYNMRLPHVKSFHSVPRYMINRLKHLVYVEAPHRQGVLAENGCVNANDLAKKNPEKALPLVWVVVDEMLGLMETMTKEEKQEFQGLLNVIVSQLPSVNIRGLFIPHRIVNDIIEKTTYELVPARVSCMGSADAIKIGLGASPKEFPYSLSKQGDMAIKIKAIQAGKVIYNHGIALTPSNDQNIELFNFTRGLWGRLEPNEKGWYDNPNSGNCSFPQSMGDSVVAVKGVMQNKGTGRASEILDKAREDKVPAVTPKQGGTTGGSLSYEDVVGGKDEFWDSF